MYNIYMCVCVKYIYKCVCINIYTLRIHKVGDYQSSGCTARGYTPTSFSWFLLGPLR